MELKQFFAFVGNVVALVLLIAPYGIETRDIILGVDVANLLIAPYGIETA